MSTEPEENSQPKRQFSQRWQQIVHAAAELFAEKGYHRTTTKEIANAAKVSEGTLYNYFENKDDILHSILKQLSKFQDQYRLDKPTLIMDARSFFKYFLDQRKEFSEKNQAMMKVILSEYFLDPTLRDDYYRQFIGPSLEIIEKQLQMRMELGQIRELDSALTARLISSLLSGLFLLQLFGDPLVNERWDELSHLATSILFDGVAP